MTRILSTVALLAVTACSGVPQGASATASPCASSEASYECQVERYQRVAH
ncbi:hypothetical protein [Ramlibacter tataouinensis]|nr:hypothetical protein [Ramlibacter tataouinensis]